MMGFGHTRSLAVLLLLFAISDGECIKKMTRLDDLMFRMFQELRSHHPDTKPFECWGAPETPKRGYTIAPENYHDRKIDQWLLPEEIGWLVDNPTLGYCCEQHRFYWHDLTLENSDNLEVGIVKIINEFYSEMHKFYRAADGHRWGCGIWGTYASIVYKDATEVFCTYRIKPKYNMLFMACGTFPNDKPSHFLDVDYGPPRVSKPRYNSWYDARMNKPREGTNWDYPAVMNKYIAEITAAKAKYGKRYWLKTMGGGGDEESDDHDYKEYDDNNDDKDEKDWDDDDKDQEDDDSGKDDEDCPVC